MRTECGYKGTQPVCIILAQDRHTAQELTSPRSTGITEDGRMTLSLPPSLTAAIPAWAATEHRSPVRVLLVEWVGWVEWVDSAVAALSQLVTEVVAFPPAPSRSTP